ncbi:hypothetical protein KIPB_011738, partial [Kipferlia bialata]|eukprot:g11738.t1
MPPDLTPDASLEHLEQLVLVCATAKERQKYIQTNLVGTPDYHRWMYLLKQHASMEGEGEEEEMTPKELLSTFPKREAPVYRLHSLMQRLDATDGETESDPLTKKEREELLDHLKRHFGISKYNAPSKYKAPVIRTPVQPEAVPREKRGRAVETRTEVDDEQEVDETAVL